MVEDTEQLSMACGERWTFEKRREASGSTGMMESIRIADVFGIRANQIARGFMLDAADQQQPEDRAT